MSDATLLTPEQIAALEALEKAVPKCPWECGRREAHDSPAMVYCDDATGQRIADCTGQYLFFSQAQKEANAAFIAALRNAAPDLISAARREAELVADLATAEARISDALETLRRIEKLTPSAANARDALDLHHTVAAIAGCAAERISGNPDFQRRGPLEVESALAAAEARIAELEAQLSEARSLADEVAEMLNSRAARITEGKHG